MRRTAIKGLEMVSLSYVNLFARDIDLLADFYSKLFELEEITASRSSIYRGFKCGASSIGFSALEAYELLGLTQPTGEGERNLVTFDVADQSKVKSLTEAARAYGASVLKEPFETYYGWYQAVLRDPEGNAFRLNFPGKAT